MLVKFPRDREDASGRNFDHALAIEGGMCIAEPNQFQKTPHHWARQSASNFVITVVVTIDVASDSASLEKLHIVSSTEQANIVDLRNSRYKELDCSRNQVKSLIASKSVKEGAIDLVQVKIICCHASCQFALPLTQSMD